MKPEEQPAIFISCSELQKATLARPFQALLATNALRGLIVSDEPRPENAWTPEEKVDAYLDRSQAVVVFATADIAAHDDAYTRPNISDEIGRARSKPHLRNRVCVLKQRGVTLPSNINPAYEGLDPDNPLEGFRKALLQLREWGFDVVHVPVAPAGAPPDGPARVPRSAGPEVDLGTVDHAELLARAEALLPHDRHTTGEMSLAVVLATAAARPPLRPAELEAPMLRAQLTQLLLFGDPALFDPGDGTNAAMSGHSLVIRQTRSWVALDANGTLVVVRPLHRSPNRGFGMSAVIEEHVRRDIEDVLRVAHQVLTLIDARGTALHVAPVVALVGAQYGAWRTAAEQAASPNPMTMNITGARRAVAHLSPPGFPRGELADGAADTAEDLTVLLRRAAVS